MNQPETRVFVVEDDPSMSVALKNLLKSVGLQAQLFASAQEFMAADRPDIASCLILDVHCRESAGGPSAGTSHRHPHSHYLHHCA